MIPPLPMDPTFRIIDACANRAREALRTMEDVARFRLGEQDLCRAIKALRHRLAEVLSAVPGGPSRLIANRDTPTDVGVEVKTLTEGARTSLREVAIAAGKRAGEALRSLEEVAKTFGHAPALWSEIERLRYRLYEVEKQLVLAMGAGRSQQWKLCVLLTESLCRRPWREVAAAAAAAGADCLQVREPAEADGALLNRVLELRRIVRSAAASPDRVSIIVNNRLDVALLAEADGVHLGTGDLPVDAARQLCGDRLIIGASTHSVDEARQAIQRGADYCGVGAMFPSSTKARPASGPEYFAQYRAEFGHVPHLAIGGITPENISTLRPLGVQGIAVSSAVCSTEDPGAVCRRFLEILA